MTVRFDAPSGDYATVVKVIDGDDGRVVATRRIPSSPRTGTVTITGLEPDRSYVAEIESDNGVGGERSADRRPFSTRPSIVLTAPATPTVSVRLVDATR